MAQSPAPAAPDVIYVPTVVTLYLLQSINERLRPKLVRELKPGTHVVSHVFKMGPEWPPDQKLMILGKPRLLVDDSSCSSRHRYPITMSGAAAVALQDRQATPDDAVSSAAKDEQLAVAGKTATDELCTQCHGLEDVIGRRWTPREWNRSGRIDDGAWRWRNRR